MCWRGKFYMRLWNTLNINLRCWSLSCGTEDPQKIFE